MVILRNGKNTRYNELTIKRLTEDLVFYTNQIVFANEKARQSAYELTLAEDKFRQASRDLAAEGIVLSNTSEGRVGYYLKNGKYLTHLQHLIACREDVAFHTLAYAESEVRRTEEDVAYFQNKAKKITQLLEEQQIAYAEVKAKSVESFKTSLERCIALDQQIREQLPPAVVQPTIYNDALKRANAATLLKQADYVTDLAKMDENKAEADYLYNLADDLKAESVAITKELDEKEQAEKANLFASVSLYRAPCVDLVVEEQNQKQDTTTASDFRARLNALLDLNQQITAQEQLVSYSYHWF